MTCQDNKSVLKSRAPWRALLLLVALLPAVAQAQARLEVIEPRHRLAEELVPLLEPVLGPEGSVSAYDNRLILRATPAQLAEVRRLLETFDRAPRQLLILVRQGGIETRRDEGVGLSGVYRRGDGSIAVPGPDGRLPRDPELQVGVGSSRSDYGASQQLRVEEGREAQLMVGTSAPTTRYRRADGTIVTTTESFGGSGVTVLPRLLGEDRVQLEISAGQRMAGGRGSYRVQNASSLVSGRLGQWIDIGGAVQQASQSGSGLLGYSEGEGRRESSLMVRVELLPE